jgi:murein L,D-transpeptidase YcbB/YkuD
MKAIIRYILLFVSAFMMLTGCRLFRKKKSNVPETHADKQVAEQINALLAASSDTNYIINGKRLETGSALKEFYKTRSSRPAWVIDEELSGEMISILSNAAYYGLDSAEYNVTGIKKLMEHVEATDDKDAKNKLFAQADLALTDAYFRFASHVSNGRLDRETLERKPVVISKELMQHLERSLKKDHITESITALEPKQADYVYLRKGMENYLKTVPLTRDSVSIPDPDKDSAGCYALVKNILIDQRYLDTNKQKNDSSLVIALRQFQTQHGLEPDGKAGANTRAALSVSTYERYKQLAVNMERWRWQDEWGTQYIFVNIPAYHLKAIKDNKKDMELRVIVGKPVTPTPEVSSKIENMITNPFWHVPQSIYSKELIPELQENGSAYLAKHSYKVFDKNNNLVDPASVDWGTPGEYRIRQDGGSQNALGRIKFNFKNKFDVYLHDTPSRSLFAKETRSMSHGCVRVQNPVELANYLLKEDNNEYTGEDIEKLIAAGQNRHINIKKQVPIHIRYFTSEASSDGRVYFYRDVYNKDKEIEAALFRE